MHGGFERQRDGINVSETHLTRHHFLLYRNCPRDTSAVFTQQQVYSRHVSSFYSTASVLETRQQFLLDCITAIAHILLLKTLQCASLKSLRTFHCSKHYSARVAIALRTLHCSKQYTTQGQTLGTLGYHDNALIDSTGRTTE
ncbi:hypothetical protein CEXT_601501 [Caerostris extrusa]|uniref:Uncharacterized protein n=1 Tax=Caerostris extrusa TaxID=172846 RepID=A0AAV4SUG1_CAEEX|nr:hypothetical protein CEXT_601501 [Caerostris extrusa]